MNGFRVIIANLDGRIIADGRCDGCDVKWSGVDLPAAYEALCAAVPVLAATQKAEGIRQEKEDAS